MLARREGTAWEIFAPAKLNLYLRVLGRRPDGFHELETFMAPVRIYDYLRWTPAPGFRFACSASAGFAQHEKLPLDEENLAFRAIQELAAAMGSEPRGSFLLQKTIPAGAGMGGGSSDAAAALLLARAAWQADVDDTHLKQIATRLGSDVPFFLARGAAVCRGRGEKVTPIDRVPSLPLVVVYPPTHLSTPLVFEQLREVDASAATDPNRATRLEFLLANLRSGAWSRAAQCLSNDLLPAARRLSGEVSRVLSALKTLGVVGATMTGSGSACVALCRSTTHARRLAGVMSSRGLGRVWATSTCH